MEMKQKTLLKSEKGGKVVELYVDNDMPLGLLFDALMELKGFAVDRMMAAHKEEEGHAESMMAEPPQNEEDE